MNWQDEGYLLSKRKFRENANIVNVFTNSFGKVSGIVYGGNSRKIKKIANTSIDISDGLCADLSQICEVSNVGAEIRQAAIPLSLDAESLVKNNRNYYSRTGEY